MNTPQSANCHCGKNTFQVKSEPEFQFVCYCEDCGQLSGGGHLCGVMFDSTQFISANHTRTYVYQGGSGDDIELHFCPDCGTHLYAFPTHYPNKVVVRANLLGDFDFNGQPLFAESALAWDKPASK